MAAIITITLFTFSSPKKTDTYIGFKTVQEYEVEEITKIFSLEPFNIIQKTEMGSIILNFKPELAKERLNKIIGEMFSIAYSI